MNMSKFLRVAAIAFSVSFAGFAGHAQDGGVAGNKSPSLSPAVRVTHARTAALLAATRAGQRIVSVGDHGVIMLSDNDGATWRQASSVPVDVLLTSVSFADEKNGWAVGHWGVVIHTSDGGETWTLQRSSLDEDRPLFAVHFIDGHHGVAVGLWSLVLLTDDGGRSWQTQKLLPPEGSKRADLNLYALFSDDNGSLFAAGERGMVLKSPDKGQNWSYLPTGYKGSFWTGAALPGGVLLVGGLRGSLYRSTDDGESWLRIATGSNASITDLKRVRSKGEVAVLAVNLDGALLRSQDGGATFTVKQGGDRTPLTALIERSSGGEVLFSRSGPIAR